MKSEEAEKVLDWIIVYEENGQEIQINVQCVSEEEIIDYFIISIS